MKRPTNERKEVKGEKGRRKEAAQSRVEIVNPSGENAEGREVAVRCEKAASRKEKSPFGWYEEFAFEWSGTFIKEETKS